MRIGITFSMQQHCIVCPALNVQSSARSQVPHESRICSDLAYDECSAVRHLLPLQVHQMEGFVVPVCGRLTPLMKSVMNGRMYMFETCDLPFKVCDFHLMSQALSGLFGLMQ